MASASDVYVEEERPPVPGASALRARSHEVMGRGLRASADGSACFFPALSPRGDSA